MTTYEPGDVVLVRFPFTDLSSAKKRPAVVISPKGCSSGRGNVVVIALTSQQQDNSSRLRDWKRAGLIKPTWVTRVIGTLHASVVLRRLGRLGASDHAVVKAAISQMIASRFLP